MAFLIIWSLLIVKKLSRQKIAFKFTELNSALSYTDVNHIIDSDGITSDVHECN